MERVRYRIEICCGSAAEAGAAQECGADRVELCSALSEGGVTPSYGEVCTARNLLNTTRLHVIIRPRGGDFCYSEREMNSMLRDIEAMRRIGVDGVVVGCLTPDGDVDVDATRRLVEAADGMSVTFHRAFDMCRNRDEALEEIVALGCQRLLTSGGCATAEAGVEPLRRLVEQSAGRIAIMPGCGINAGNIAFIADRTLASEFHFSARRLRASAMRYRNTNVSMGGDGSVDEYAVPEADIQKIMGIRNILNSI